MYKPKACYLALLLVLCFSCVATVKKDDDSFNSRIMAENSSIKKRLPLIERENDVLRKENHQNRNKILALETKIKNLGLELAFLSEKYDNDIANGEMQIKNLELMIQEIEKESLERIKLLTLSKEAVQKKSAREIQVLKKKIIGQKKKFELEVTQIKKANAKRENSLSDQIKILKNDVEIKTMENASLKNTNSEISIKLSETQALVETLKKSRDDLLAELETAKATNARLTNALNSQ
jgi:TolA-binding protein